MNSRYVFLQGEIPQWVSDKLMIYRTPEGGIGYELDTGKFDKVIFKGDKLIKRGKYIKVIRGDRSGERTESVD
jgi:hypothetical protein